MWCRSGTRECDGCTRCQPEPRAVGRCAECGGDIVEGEEYYDICGETIHEDCLYEWAQKFRVTGHMEEAV